MQFYCLKIRVYVIGSKDDKNANYSMPTYSSCDLLAEAALNGWL